LEPGSSLWLLPPADSKIERELHTLINSTFPGFFPNIQLPHFPPHITLTSEVDPALDPTTVTSSIEITSAPDVRFTNVNIGKTFFTRVTLYLEKTEKLKALAADCRQRFVTNGNTELARKWVEDSYVPHLSLIYMEELPEPDIVEKIQAEVAKAGVEFGVDAWEGGRIALVNCSEPIDKWRIEGERIIYSTDS